MQSDPGTREWSDQSCVVGGWGDSTPSIHPSTNPPPPRQPVHSLSLPPSPRDTNVTRDPKQQKRAFIPRRYLPVTGHHWDRGPREGESEGKNRKGTGEEERNKRGKEPVEKRSSRTSRQVTSPKGRPALNRCSFLINTNTAFSLRLY